MTAKVRIPGMRLMYPDFSAGTLSNYSLLHGNIALDADEEEAQLIGKVIMPGGPGTSKTFGTSGSTLGWIAGASNTFGSGATLRVGVKKASSIDTSAGPPARATIGAAAFDVYDDLVGGTDTISNTTWRADAMSAGTPFTVTHGDFIAICWHLDVASGSPVVNVRGCAPLAAFLMPVGILVTAGPTYTGQTNWPHGVLKFDDGTYGVIDPTVLISSNATSTTIGSGDIIGTRFVPPVPMVASGMAARFSNTTGDLTMGIWLESDPSAPLVSVDLDGNVHGVSATIRPFFLEFASEIVLSPSKSYVVGIKQTTATAVAIEHYDIGDTAHAVVQPGGVDCYAVESVGGAAFGALNSNLRRVACSARVSALFNPVSPTYQLGL